ncbi:MAG: hypothetical protein EA425_12525, partial [Puniceicoccaceae bacterium]
DFGAAVSTTVLAEESPRGETYRRVLEEHFNALVAENAMKWYAIQPEPGPRLWTEADQFLDFAAERGLRFRGHTIFWSKAHWVQDWVHELTQEALRAVVEDHLRSVVQRYAGRLTGWDVNNEMMTGSFFLDRLGPEIRPWMYRETRRLDPGVPLFLNEYGLLRDDAKLDAFLEHCRELLRQGAPVGAIGLQQHHLTELIVGDEREGPGQLERGGLDPAEAISPWQIWERLDRLSGLGLPIVLTEISCATPDEARKADALGTLLRVAFAHPRVEGFYLWGFWEGAHFKGRQGALITRDWEWLPAAEAVFDPWRDEWRTLLEAMPDGEGEIAFRGFFGDYRIAWTGEDGAAREVEVTLGADRWRAAP